MRPEYKKTMKYRVKARQYSKEYRIKSREKVLKYWLDFNSSEKRKSYMKEYLKKYNKKHKHNYSVYRKNKIKHDINFKLSVLLRGRISDAVRGKYKFKYGSAVSDLGCTIKELQDYIESMFKQGMSWENHGKWHIDHKIPLCSFNLSNRDEFLKACHYTNLQPLWAKENLSKGRKV